jgi:hypothetical protein
MLPWDPNSFKGQAKPRNPPTWAVSCEGMSYVFSYAQHPPIHTSSRAPSGRLLVYRRCIICWAMEGVVSKKLDKEEWLVHLNEFFTSGGYEMCRNKDAKQQRRRKCEIRACKKMHSVG